MSKVRTTWAELDRGRQVETNTPYTFVVPRAYAHVMTLPGALFEAGSAVPHELPSPRPADLGTPLHTLSGSLAAAMRYAEANPDYSLLVSGSVRAPTITGHGLAHARARAQAVHALLVGDRDTFGQACRYHQGKDQARMLSWAAQAFGYPCEVPPNTGRSAGALRAFRAHHTELHGGSLPALAAARVQDFGALYDLYEQCLMDALDGDASTLKAARAKLSFLDPPTDAGGDFWPLQARGLDRLDLFFFEPPEAPPDYAGDYGDRHWKPGTSLYYEQRYVRRVAEALPAEPAAVCVRMRGAYFDTNKCFVLPGAAVGMQALVELYAAQPQGELLVVGHTDASGQPAVNDPLSLERARSVLAFLTEDVEAWLAYYKSSTPRSQRWGEVEDGHMLAALPDGSIHLAQPEPMKNYQRSRGLQDDGICGPNTRRHLIADYMALDGTSLPEGIEPVAHGCGENFPLTKPDSDPSEEEMALDRRVELYLFADKATPPPPGDNSEPGAQEYLKWRRATVRELELKRTSLLAVRVGYPHRPDVLSDKPYRLSHGKEVLEGTIGPDGVIGIPKRMQGAEALPLLEVKPFSNHDRWYAWELQPGQLADAHTLVGAQARLYNQGFYLSEIDGKQGPETRCAVRSFQHRHGLVADAELTPETLSALIKNYGC